MCYYFCMENAVSYDDLKTENEALKSDFAALSAKHTALEANYAEVKGTLSWLLEQLSSSNRKLYGQSSEKSVYDQIGFFGDRYADPLVADREASGVEPAATPKKQKPKKQGEIGSRLPEGRVSLAPWNFASRRIAPDIAQ